MRHNYATNPSLETGTTGYATTGGVLTSGGTLTNPSGGAVGTKQGHVAVTASGQGVSFTAAPAAPGRFKLLAQRPVDPDYKAFVLSKSPAFYLALDSTDGFTDLSGNGRNGTAAGGVTAGSATGPHHRFNGVGTRTNYVTNPNFETNITNLNAGASAIAQSTTQAYDGTNSLRVTSSASNYNANATATQANVGVAGTAYTFSFYLFNTVASRQGRADIRFYDSGGTIIGSATSGTAATATQNTWTRFSVTATAPALTAYIGYVCRCDAGGVAAASEISYIDGILIEAASSAGTYFPTAAQLASGEARWLGTADASGSELAVQASGAAFFDGIDDRVDTGYNTRRNYAANPNFETNVTTAILLQSAPTVTRVTSDFYDGTAAMRIQASAVAGCGVYSWAWGGGFNTNDGLTPSTDYTASVYVKANGAGEVGKQIVLRLNEWTAGKGAQVGTSSSSVRTLTEAWQRVTVTRTFGATGVNAYMFLYALNADSPDFLTDAWMIEKASSAGTYFPTTAQLASGEAGWTGTANASASEIGPLANGTPRTFMFWLNRDPAGYGTGRITLGNQLGGAGQYDVILQFSSTNATLYMGGTAAVTWSGLPAAGAYNHYMIVVDKTAVNRARLYVNGLLHTAETDISARSWYGGTTTQNLQVGRYAGSQYTYGKMGGVSVHYSALTATDAANAFASGRAEFILASGTTELGRAVAGTAWTQLDFPVSSGSQTLSIRTIAPRDFEFDAVQVGDDIDYRDGNHPGWEWTGTPDASTSQSLVGPDARHPILTIADYEAAIELAEQETTMTIENPTTTTEIET